MFKSCKEFFFFNEIFSAQKSDQKVHLNVNLQLFWPNKALFRTTD